MSAHTGQPRGIRRGVGVLALGAVAAWAAAGLAAGGTGPRASAGSLCARLGGSWSTAVAFGESQGELAFSGHAGFIGFEGRAQRFEGCLAYDGRPEASALVLEVPAGSLTTGLALRDQHMASAIQKERYPVIRFEYGPGALRVNPPEAGAPPGQALAEWTAGTIDGTLGLAGLSRPQGVTVRWRRNGACLEVEGGATVSLAAYGIPAPRFLWLQVEDAVRVRFSLRIPLGGPAGGSESSCP